jgi:pimeloyl-ACP methyl ester carboxylesterase
VKISFAPLIRTRNLTAFMCAIFLLLTLGLICGCRVCFAQTNTLPNAPLQPGRLIDLGGYKLHLNCTGQGSPAVVLLAGAGDFSFDWDLVQPQAAKFTRVCSYDRAGEAWSDLGPRPRTMFQEAFDLHRLLRAAGERPPYILVGQSLGGMVARIFAMEHPGETAGLVLVDAFDEDAQLFMNGKLVRVRMLSKDREIPAPRTSVTAGDALSTEEKQKIEAMIKQFKIKPEIDAPFDKLPVALQKERIWALSELKHFAATADDYLPEETAKIYVETRAATFPLGNLPLIVLSRSKDDYPPSVAEEMSKEHKDEQESLSELSKRGKLIVVPNSGHHIQLDAPNAVIGAIETEVSASHN